MKTLKIVFLVITLFFCTLNATESVQRELITHPEAAQNRIEFYFLKPDGEGPFPVLFLLAGYQPEGESPGGKQLVDLFYLNRLANEGIAAVSISVPGFGTSDGKRDLSGPYSQRAILAVIDHCKKFPFVDPKRMGIYGISRGATLGSMVSARSPDLSLQILESGEYDLTSQRRELPDYLAIMKENLLKEAGDSREALLERSSVYHTTAMHQKTLLLHGEFDDRRGLSSAKLLHQKLLDQGVFSFLKIYPHGLHTLGPEKWEVIIPFLREHFLGIVGIGIGIEQVGSVLEISKIEPGAAADQSKKLKIGDAILAISPNNDEHLLSALRMPLKTFISHLLGKPGSPLRLRVQHFDYTIEDVIIERNSSSDHCSISSVRGR